MIHRVRLAVVLAGLLAGTDLAACGDKFLVVGRGTRFQRGPATARTYSVLLYAPPASVLSDPAHRLSFEKTLTRAGFVPVTAASPSELAENMKGGSSGVVITDIGDAPSVLREAGAGPARPSGVVVVPLLSDASSQAVHEARKIWGVALKATAGPIAILAAIGEALDRLSGAGQAAAPGP